MGKTSNAVKDRYNAKAYDDIRLRVPKGQKEKIQAFSESNGETVNGFINRLISEAMGVDKTTDNDENAQSLCRWLKQLLTRKYTITSLKNQSKIIMNFLSIFDSAEFAIQDKGDEDMRYTGSEHIETLN